MVFIGCIAAVWGVALTGRTKRLVSGALVLLAAEGALDLLSRGRCPLADVWRRLGDETPLFELVLGPRLARPASPSWQRSPLPARQSCSSVWSLDPGCRPGVTAPSARAKRPMRARRSGAGQGTFRVFPMAVGPGARRVCRRSSTRRL